MNAATRLQGFDRTPEAVVAAWPTEWPLAAVWSGHGIELGRARWTVIAKPGRCVTTNVGLDPVWSALRGPAERGDTGGTTIGAPPFSGGWIGWISYDAGRALEPRASVADGAKDDRGWLLAVWVRVDDALIHDRERGEWWGMGSWRNLVECVEAGRRRADLRFQISNLESQTGRERYVRTVHRATEYIRSGDVYQANIAHRLSGAFNGSARGLFLALMRSAQPWYGGYLEMVDDQGLARVVASASPELFVEFDPRTRRVLTRPMKGTRPGAGDPDELAAAEKDRAELNMIIDLMRNDLGRVCEFGSVRVAAGRQIGRHGRHDVLRRPSGPADPGGLLQATATVSGRVRPGLSLPDLLRAVFPGGSVTGAPKIRAMQIIDELESARRGPYCGCFGWVGDDGAAALNILIRTALLSGAPAGPAGAPASTIGDGVLDYSVGAGIVADSDPEREWEETMAKAGILTNVAALGSGGKPETCRL